MVYVSIIFVASNRWLDFKLFPIFHFADTFSLRPNRKWQNLHMFFRMIQSIKIFGRIFDEWAEVDALLLLEFGAFLLMLPTVFLRLLSISCLCICFFFSSFSIYQHDFDEPPLSTDYLIVSIRLCRKIWNPQKKNWKKRINIIECRRITLALICSVVYLFVWLPFNFSICLRAISVNRWWKNRKTWFTNWLEWKQFQKQNAIFTWIGANWNSMINGYCIANNKRLQCDLY